MSLEREISGASQMIFQDKDKNLETLLEDELVQTIKSIFHALSSRRDLSPNEDTDALFKYLIRIISSSNSNHNGVVESLQKDGTLQKLIKLNCRGEIELERYWANKIIEGKNELTQFPYYGNYVLLTKFELEHMQKYMDLDGKRLLFVGSGALPFTAMMFKQQQPSLDVRCIDKDAEFVRLSGALLSKLGIGYLPVSLRNIADLDSDTQSMLSASNVVFIAALVGDSNSEKNRILASMHPYLNPISVVAVRSVPTDLRRLLYPKFELDDSLRIKYLALGEYSLPKETGVINSIAILSRR